MTLLVQADAIHIPLRDQSVQTVITSPPYWALRKYRAERQLGHEKTHHEYVAKMVAVMREVRRVLRDDGLLWLNLGDTFSGSNGNGYAQSIDGYNATGADENISLRSSLRRRDTLPPKCRVGIPWRVALAMIDDGWVLRMDNIWDKSNPRPESVRDRPTASHEYWFMFSKSSNYYYDGAAVREVSVDPESHTGVRPRNASRMYVEDKKNYAFAGSIKNGKRRSGQKYPTRNRRSVWRYAVSRWKGTHYATFPPQLVLPLVLSSSRPGDLVLDPFCGTGTVGEVCYNTGRRFIGQDISWHYLDNDARRRTKYWRIWMPPTTLKEG